MPTTAPTTVTALEVKPLGEDPEAIFAVVIDLFDEFFGFGGGEVVVRSGIGLLLGLDSGAEFLDFGKD